MNLFDITFKDIRQMARSRSAFIFMFVIPIGITTLFAFMFSGIASEDEEFTLPQTAVLIVNLDEGSTIADDNPLALSGIDSMGALLIQLLQDDELSEIIGVTEMNDEAAARAAVDNQEASVAMIIPAGFTDALLGGGETGTGATAVVELYSDPTLTLGPAIVEGIAGQFVNAFAASNIGVGVTVGQLAEAGQPVTPELVQSVIDRYTAAMNQQTTTPLVTRTPPTGSTQSNELAEMLASIMGGMMVFFAFFTGANVLQSIITEEEQGTLQRLFTTPATYTAIFSGKFVAALVILLGQVAVLLMFGRLIFDIYWGQLLNVVLAALGLIVIAATTGLFLVSMLKNSRQAGSIFGGLLTITGMIGLIGVFTAGAPNTPAALNTVSLLVPQGWAIRGFTMAMNNDSLANIAVSLAVTLLWSGIFYFIGQRRLEKRFA